MAPARHLCPRGHPARRATPASWGRCSPSPMHANGPTRRSSSRSASPSPWQPSCGGGGSAGCVHASWLRPASARPDAQDLRPGQRVRCRRPAVRLRRVRARHAASFRRRHDGRARHQSPPEAQRRTLARCCLWDVSPYRPRAPLSIAQRLNAQCLDNCQGGRGIKW